MLHSIRRQQGAAPEQDVQVVSVLRSSRAVRGCVQGLTLINAYEEETTTACRPRGCETHGGTARLMENHKTLQLSRSDEIVGKGRGGVCEIDRFPT